MNKIQKRITAGVLIIGGIIGSMHTGATMIANATKGKFDALKHGVANGVFVEIVENVERGKEKPENLIYYVGKLKEITDGLEEMKGIFKSLEGAKNEVLEGLKNRATQLYAELIEKLDDLQEKSRISMSDFRRQLNQINDIVQDTKNS